MTTNSKFQSRDDVRLALVDLVVGIADLVADLADQSGDDEFDAETIATMTTLERTQRLVARAYGLVS